MNEIDKKEGLRFISAIEDGNYDTATSYNIIDRFDPLFSFFLLKYLREKHPITENSSGAGARLLELLSTYPSIAKLAQVPKNEPLVDWFNDAYSTKSFFTNAEPYVELIVDKLEG